MKENRLAGIFMHWLPVGVAIVGLAGLSYLLVQQTHRSELNNPQVQLAQDAATALANGKAVSDVVTPSDNDIEQSLAPFVGVYDKDGKPIAVSGKLGKEDLRPPIGVLKYTNDVADHRVSWQPNAKTRIALVVTKVQNDSGMYVASGRNMQEEENQIQKLTAITVIAIVFTLVFSFAADVIGDKYRRKMMAAMQNQNK